MKKIIYILILIVLVSAQDKYLVSFTDKGISEIEFNRSPQKFYSSTEISLTKRAIERRKKVLGENYIKYQDLPLNTEYINKIQNLGLKIAHKLRWVNAVSVYAKPSQVEKISQFQFVKNIEKIRSLEIQKLPLVFEKNEYQNLVESSDLNYGNSLLQSELHDIPIVHDAGFNGQNILIGFIDSGYDWKEHPALKDLDVIYEYDYVFDDNETADESDDVMGQDWHGTSVFSIGAGFEEGRLIGPAFGSQFLLAKTENVLYERNIEEDYFAAAVEDLENMGADIITASLGYSVFDSGEESYTYEDMDGNTTIVAKVYNTAFDLGVVTIAAAGNEGQTDWRYILSPADAFNVIAVGNSTISGELNQSSSRGPTADGRIKPEVIAMGTSNYHAIPGGGYSNAGVGSSFSAPMVAGMAAQLLSAHPHLTNQQVRNIIIHAGNNFENPNNDVGYGLLSAKRALNFPNVQLVNGNYQINKMLLGEEIINNSDFKFYYKRNNSEWESVLLSYNEFQNYPVELPANFVEDDQVTFYYTYQDTSSQLKRIPQDYNYLVTLSEDEVGLITSIVESPDELSNEFMLFQNYPNPFNLETSIEFISPKTQSVSVTIYNVLGQKIRELFSGRVIEGKTKLSWDGRNDYGKIVSTGTYFYSVSFGTRVLTKKMVLLK